MFAKIFKSLFNGTMRGTRDLITVWVNILANSDAHGFVDITPRVISEETGVPLDIVERCITQLESPDPESRTPDLAGSRLERIDEHRAWGWRIVNFEKYRNTCTSEQRKEQLRIAQERYRAKKAGQPESQEPQTQPAVVIPENLNTPVFLSAWEAWRIHREEIKKKLTPMAIEKQLKRLSELGVDAAITAIEHSIGNSYQGIYQPKERNNTKTVGQSVVNRNIGTANEHVKFTPGKNVIKA